LLGASCAQAALPAAQAPSVDPQTLDKDGDGHITFKEYLMAYYRGATAKEIKQMLEWTQPKEVQEEEEEDLSAEQIEELKAMFNLYDKNKNGTLDKCVRPRARRAERLRSTDRGCLRGG